MLVRKIGICLFVVILTVVIVIAQDDACPAIVANALEATDNACSDTERNQACYGNVQIDATFADDSISFTQQGDKVNLLDIEEFTLSPLDEETSAWGVALMSVQANIPDTIPGQNVTFLLFGDVSISNAGEEMEAFYFKSGIGTAGCDEAESGILITTPKGIGTIELVANDVTIELGSTAYLTAEPNDVMTVALLEGNATVTAEDVSQVFEGGNFVTVPINEDLEAIGAPSEPEPLPEDFGQVLPDIQTFAPEDEDGDGSNDDGTTTSGTPVDLVPLAGNWTYVPGDIIASDSCPAMLTGAMQSGMPINTTYIDFGEEFDLQAVMMSTGGQGLEGATFDNPSAGVYTMFYEEEGFSMEWTMSIMSEKLIEGEYFMDMTVDFNCIMTIPFTVSLEE